MASTRVRSLGRDRFRDGDVSVERPSRQGNLFPEGRPLRVRLRDRRPLDRGPAAALGREAGARRRQEARPARVAAGKAPSKRNAEVMAVEQVMRWRSEVLRFAPDRLEEFDELIADALNNPAPVQKVEQ